MCKFFFISDFINQEISQNLINYFKSYDFKILGNDPSNSYWDSHVLRYENMPICKERNILKNIHNTVCNHLKNFFELDVLYPESTHLVRWEPGRELNDHADNSWLDGTPNYSPNRVCSAVINLSGQDEGIVGGNFYFRNPYIKLPLIRGNLVGFTSGLDCVHGVTKVEKGDRYTIAMWFTSTLRKEYI